MATNPRPRRTPSGPELAAFGTGPRDNDHDAALAYYHAQHNAAIEQRGDWLVWRDLSRAAMEAQRDAEYGENLLAGWRDAIDLVIDRAKMMRQHWLAQQLADRLRKAGCTWEAKAGQLWVGPRKALTPELQSEITTHRESLMQIA